jgi:4-hydroxy-3-polyprenylbenzoate decarboxylase
VDAAKTIQISAAICKSDRVKILMELTVAVTGASGTIYAERTLRLLAASGACERINLIMSGVVPTVAQVELGVNLKEPNQKKINEWLGLAEDSRLVRFWQLDNLAAKPASGSNKQIGMIIVPCSMGTLGAIASGAGTNLIHRAADVALKENRKLVLVPRETPFNQIHLENMLRLSRAGATILAAIPATTITTRADCRTSLSDKIRWIPATPASQILLTRLPIVSATSAASSATGISLVPAVTTAISPAPNSSLSRRTRIRRADSCHSASMKTFRITP